MNRRKSVAWSALAGALFLTCSAAHAQGWCKLIPGWSVVTYGTKANDVFLLARFQGAPGDIWIRIADENVGKPDIAMALAAQLAGKNLSLYVDSPEYSCATFPSWAPLGQIRHMRVID